ncbi:hypothetical protein [Acidithiobacillus sp.]
MGPKRFPLHRGHGDRWGNAWGNLGRRHGQAQPERAGKQAMLGFGGYRARQGQGAAIGRGDLDIAHRHGLERLDRGLGVRPGARDFDR